MQLLWQRILELTGKSLRQIVIEKQLMDAEELASA